MTINEAKDYLNHNGFELIDEGFFGSAYEKYKKTVLKLISKYGVYDCAQAIKDNI